MIEFWVAVGQYEFLRQAVWGCLLASLACGVVGSFVVVRRLGGISGAIAHAVLGGMGAARWCQVSLGWAWFTPLAGALVAAGLAAGIIGWASLRGGEREDTVISALWAVGMALGILFIQATPGYQADLMSYLFGNVLMITPADLWLLAGLDILVLAVAGVFYHQLVAVSFDEEFARLRGVPTRVYYFLLLGMAGVTVVLLSAVVGLILVIALLVLPAAMAGRLGASLGAMMAWATLFTAGLTTGGLALSYGPDLPPGATIILLTGLCYLLLRLVVGWRRSRLSS